MLDKYIQNLSEGTGNPPMHAGLEELQFLREGKHREFYFYFGIFQMAVQDNKRE